jgi:omega-6 fatty acid desaturase (delta-12 desaturase)
MNAAIMRSLTRSLFATLLVLLSIPRKYFAVLYDINDTDTSISSPRRCSLGVPYFSWRISHAQHHAFTGHMAKDQAHIPFTRSNLDLPPFDPTKEDLFGSRVREEVRKELREALSDTPLGGMLRGLCLLAFGWQLYLLKNFRGQASYPKGTNRRHDPPSYASHHKNGH